MSWLLLNNNLELNLTVSIQSLHRLHEHTAYSSDHVCWMTIHMFQVKNEWVDLDEIWYKCSCHKRPTQTFTFYFSATVIIMWHTHGSVRYEWHAVRSSCHINKFHSFEKYIYDKAPFSVEGNKHPYVVQPIVLLDITIVYAWVTNSIAQLCINNF